MPDDPSQVAIVSVFVSAVIALAGYAWTRRNVETSASAQITQASAGLIERFSNEIARLNSKIDELEAEVVQERTLRLQLEGRVMSLSDENARLTEKNYELQSANNNLVRRIVRMEEEISRSAARPHTERRDDPPEKP